jgi:predicted permease
MPKFRNVWRNLVHRKAVDADLDDELRAAFELAVDEQVAAGVSRNEARRHATIRFGRISAITTDIVQTRAGAGFEQLRQDVTFGVRLLRRSPVFALTAALSLGAGVGATTTIFTLVNALMLRELPVAQPRQLIEIGRITQRGQGFSFSYPAYERLRDENRVFSGLIALSRETIEGRAGDGQDAAAGRFVSGNFFETLGIVPMAGRLLSPTDDRLEASGESAVAVVAYRFWQRALGGNPSAIGQTLRIDAVRFTIVGVLPPTFEDVVVGRPADFYVPIASEPLVDRDSQLREAASSWLGIAGRLRTGLTQQDAHTNLAPILSAFLADVSATNQDSRMREAIRSQRLFLQSARRGLTDVWPSLSSPVLLLMGAVCLVLLIACVNVIALLLGRGVARRREISLRLAIGASRTRLIRQLLTESMLLGAAGAAIGLLMAVFGAPLVVRILSQSELPLTLDVTPDLRVLLFTLLIAVGSATIAGSVPALRTVRRGFTSGVNTDARSTACTRESARAGQALVAAQVALSLLLVVGSGLLLATLRNLHRIDAGFDARNVFLLKLDPARIGFADERLAQYYRDVLAHVRATPGVQHASLSSITPLSGSGTERPFQIEGRPPESGVPVSANRITEDFFATMRTRVVLGRDFVPKDGANGPGVAIVNDALARRYFNAASPIGQRIVLGDRRPRQIVGVVANAKYYSLRDGAIPTVYIPVLDGVERRDLTLAVRTLGAPFTFADIVRERVTSIAPAVPVSRGRTLASQLESSMGTERLIAQLLSAFALLSLGLAAVGLYGVLGYSVARRTSEIGVRLALGATPAGVLRAVLRQAAMMVLVGSAIGVPGALLLSRFLTGLLYGVTPADPPVLGFAVSCLFLVAIAAAAVPAWRAARVDPLVALRHE